jgi:hypothetical protein
VQKQQTIEGRGVLVCGTTKTDVTYRLTLLSDQPGTERASGSLHVAGASIPVETIIAGPCRLILEDDREFAVHVTRSDASGDAYVQSTGPIPDV